MMRSGGRIGKTHQVSTRQSDMETATEANDTEQPESAASCPFSSLLGAASLGKATPPAEGHQADDAVRTPGPPPLGLESMMDVSQIVIHGIQVAMLNYFEKYGPVCRYIHSSCQNHTHPPHTNGAHLPMRIHRRPLPSFLIRENSPLSLTGSRTLSI